MLKIIELMDYIHKLKIDRVNKTINKSGIKDVFNKDKADLSNLSKIYINKAV